MFQIKRNAFTMLELTFVIVIIGILSAIAIPKFAATRDDAVITKARTTVAAVRNSLSAERQKRILRGDFTPITDLGDTTNAFSTFSADKNGQLNSVMEYPIQNCPGTGRSCWIRTNALTYVFRTPLGSDATFSLIGNRFNCTSNCENFNF